MAVNIPKLIVSSKITVSAQPTNPLMKIEKGHDVGAFIIAFLQEYSKVLPVYASNAAAVAAGLQSGTVYLLPTAGGQALAFVI